MSSDVATIFYDGDCGLCHRAVRVVLAADPEGRAFRFAPLGGETFRALMQARGAGLDADAEDRLGDATAFTGVARYPARIKCALLGWAALRDALAKAGADLGGAGTMDIDEEER